jgi:hypothetical protein
MCGIVDHSGPHHILCAPVVPSANFPLGHKVEGRSETRFFASLIIPAGAQTERAGTMGEPTNYLTLTDAVIRNTTMPPGKAQHYLHDDKLPGLALRMRATGGRTWVYLFTKPGVKGTQRKTLGAWPRFNERAARKAATIAAGEADIFLPQLRLANSISFRVCHQRHCQSPDADR